MQDILTIGKIAKIRTGHTFKAKVVSSASGNIRVLQPADFHNGQLVNVPAQVEESEIRNLENHLLYSNDILITNKGIRFSTYLYPESDTLSVAASSFFVIRPFQNMVNPEYLLWYLGRPEIIRVLEAQAKGSIVPSIKLGAIQNLEIELPSMNIQQKIARVVALGKEREALMQNLIASKKESIELYCLDLIKHAHEADH